MNNPYFSLIIPTRLRVNTITLCLNSIRDTVTDPTNVEVRIIIDEDDYYTKRAIPRLKTIYTNTIVHERNRGVSYVDDYFNWCTFKYCKGKFIIGGTDDALIRSKGWDVNCIERLEEYLKDKKDGIACGILDDKEYDEKRQTAQWLTCDYPIISMNGIKALGFYFDPHFPRYGSDWDITYTYNQFNRIVDLRDIFVYEREPKEIQAMKEDTVYNINTTPLVASLGRSYPKGYFLKDNLERLENYIKYENYNN